MRFFALLDFQHLVLAFFLGLLGFLFVCLAWGYYPRRPPGEEAEPESEGLRLGHSPIVPSLIFIYVGVSIWAIGYMVVVGVFGGPIG